MWASKGTASAALFAGFVARERWRQLRFAGLQMLLRGTLTRAQVSKAELAALHDFNFRHREPLFVKRCLQRAELALQHLLDAGRLGHDGCHQLVVYHRRVQIHFPEEFRLQHHHHFALVLSQEMRTLNNLRNHLSFLNLAPVDVRVRGARYLGPSAPQCLRSRCRGCTQD